MEKSKIKEIIEWVICIVVAIVVALILRYFVATPTIVQQVSMFPTLKPNERLVLNRMDRGKMPQRGDIITFEAPSKKLDIHSIEKSNPTAIYDEVPKNIFSKFAYYVLEMGKRSYIKRVIGLPGEHIKVEEGKVYVNGEEIKENYLSEEIVTQTKNFNDIVVPNGYVFVMGDNRENSTDSRELGCIPISKIEGKAIFRFWPLNKWGII